MVFSCPIRIKESRSFSELVKIVDSVASRKVVAQFCSPKGKVGGAIIWFVGRESHLSKEEPRHLTRAEFC